MAFKCTEEELENALVTLLPKKIHLKKEIYGKWKDFLEDLGHCG